MTWVYVAAAAFAITLAAIVLFILSANRLRLPNGLFYVILIPLGVTAAAFLFGAMRSHATYKGQSSYGTLELSGPVVVLALVVLGGMFANRAETFALTVRVHGPDGPSDIVRSGALTADLAGVRRTSTIGSDGEVVFADVPDAIEGSAIRLFTDVPGLRAVDDTTPIVVPASHIIEFALTRRTFATAVRGTVQEANGRPVRGAVLNFNAGAVTVVSDSGGNFHATLPLNAGAVIPLTVAVRQTVRYDDNITVAEQPALRIVVRASP